MLGNRINPLCPVAVAVCVPSGLSDAQCYPPRRPIADRQGVSAQERPSQWRFRRAHGNTEEARSLGVSVAPIQVRVVAVYRSVWCGSRGCGARSGPACRATRGPRRRTPPGRSGSPPRRLAGRLASRAEARIIAARITPAASTFASLCSPRRNSSSSNALIRSSKLPCADRVEGTVHPARAAPRRTPWPRAARPSSPPGVVCMEDFISSAVCRCSASRGSKPGRGWPRPGRG